MIRFGIAGFGIMGKKYAEILSNGAVNNACVSAVCSRTVRKAEEIKAIDKNISIFNNTKDMFESGCIDAVIITVPHYLHVKIAVEAMSYNINVLCEKPAGVFTKEIKFMNQKAHESKVSFGMIFNQRTNHLYRKLKEIIDSNEMGNMRRLVWIVNDWYRTDSYFNSSPWRATWNGEGGGVLINQSVHNLDLMQWLVGMPDRVRAFCHEGFWHDIETEDDVTAYFEFKNGATGTFITSTGEYPGTNRLEISFDGGKLLCENNKIIKFKNKIYLKEFDKINNDTFGKPECTSEEIETDGENSQYIGVLENFAESVLNGKKLIADGSEGLNSIELVNAMYLSSWLDKTIELPIDDDIYLQELNKKRGIL